MSLIVCSRCARHHRASEEACPFCRAERAWVGPVAAAIVAATLAGGACKEETAVPLYGIPPMDAGVDAGTPDGG